MNIVSFKNQGRLGNFLFEAAATLGYAWRNELDYTVPNTTKSPENNPIYLQHLVNPKFHETDAFTKITEKGHPYQKLPYSEEWRGKLNVVLEGYWQSEKYFSEYRTSLLRTFNFPWKPRPGFVSVHVRRGDYLRLTKKHPSVPVSWIMEAMIQFHGSQFVFFSDDIQWCKDVFGRRRDVTFSEGGNAVQDLVEGSWCEHHICSASTFSWWQAWLNQNLHKRVIIPKHWFVPGRPENTSDIVPLGWTRL